MFALPIPKDDDDCCRCKVLSDVVECIDLIGRGGMVWGGDDDGCDGEYPEVRGWVDDNVLLVAAALRPYPGF